MRMGRIYLDYIASSPADDAVIAAMQPYLAERFGNASSIHSFGQEAQVAIDEARDSIAGFFGVRSSELYMTGSATEADNWAIKGVIGAQVATGKQLDELHIVTTTIEHKAVLETVKHLERAGLCVTYVDPNEQGLIDVNDIDAAIQDNTVLVSAMYVNNEVGSIQPIAEIGRCVRKKRDERSAESLPIYLHTDAVQGVQFLDCTAEYLGYDLLTFSGHKIYGPKGIGGLVIRRGVVIDPLIHGGGQEAELRSGTENVPAIVGLGRAFEMLQSSEHKVHSAEIATMRDEFISIFEGLQGADIVLNGPRGVARIHNNINISIESRDAEQLVIGLDLKGVAISAGSACSAGAVETSYVLKAMQVSNKRAQSAIRISLGKQTTRKELDACVEILSSLL